MSGVDVFSQFQKLCPAHRGGLSAKEKLGVVERQLAATRALSARAHWAYDLNRHEALIELRNALADACARREVA